MKCANCDYSMEMPSEWDPVSSLVIKCPSCKEELEVRVTTSKTRLGPLKFFYTILKAKELINEKQERDSDDSQESS